MRHRGENEVRSSAEMIYKQPVEKTRELYRVPVEKKTAAAASICIGSPRYQHGEFKYGIEEDYSSTCILDLTDAEKEALVIIVLTTTLKEERFGAPHQRNWKKVGLSRASYKAKLVCENAMPTPRAKAAFAL